MYFDFGNCFTADTDRITQEIGKQSQSIMINRNGIELPHPFIIVVEPIDSTNSSFDENNNWELYYYVTIEVKYNDGDKWIPVERRILFHSRRGAAGMQNVTIENKVYKDPSAPEFWYQYSEEPMIFSRNCTVRCTFSLNSETTCDNWGFVGSVCIVPVPE